MRRFFDRVRAGFRLSATRDADVRSHLVESLYASPRSLTIGAVAGVTISCLMAYKTHDPRLTTFAAAICVVGGLRVASAFYFHRQLARNIDVLSRRWAFAYELAYELGAWLYAGLLGALAFAVLQLSDRVELHVLGVALATGYAGGISGRNAGRVHIAMGQTCLALLPTALGLALHDDAGYRLLAGILCLMVLGMAEISRTTHRIVLEAVAGRQEKSLLAAKFERLARFDSLTGIENRMAMQMRLRDMFDGSALHKDGLAIVWVDLDRFKEINDSLGHIVGDQLLCAVAERLAGAMKGTGHAARFGGDEFILLCPGLDRPAASRVAQDMLDIIAQPIELGGHMLTITASLGVAIGMQDGRDSDELLQHADMALYHAKHEGRNRFAAFSWGMKERFNRIHDIESGLRRAIDQNELSIRYQPIFDLATGHVACCEALLRWRHPILGEVSPAEFIPIAEGNMMIAPITQWVLANAMQTAVLWPPDVRLAVNISPILLKSDGLPRTVIEALVASGLPARRLELEVTESVFLENSRRSSALLLELQKIGLRLALDDFGTGYSSLSYLRSYPFDAIKIDQSFMRGAAESIEDRAVTHAVADLARRLKMETVAEGIETREQLLYACEIGITSAQGYHLCRPLPPEELGPVLRDGVDVPVLGTEAQQLRA